MEARDVVNSAEAGFVCLMEADACKEVHKLLPILEVQLCVLQLERYFSNYLGHSLDNRVMIVLKHEHFKQIRHQLTLDHLLVESLEHVRNAFHRFDADVGLLVIQQLAYFRDIRLLQTWAALESLEVNRQIFFHENGPVHPNFVVSVPT